MKGGELAHYLENLADTEIAYLYRTRTSNQKIVRFNIPMHDILQFTE